MGGYRILNVAHPRDPREYESDFVTSKILYDYAIKVDQNYMRRDRDGSVVVPYCYLFFLSVFILWFSYYIFCQF